MLHSTTDIPPMETNADLFQVQMGIQILVEYHQCFIMMVQFFTSYEQMELILINYLKKTPKFDPAQLGK